MKILVTGSNGFIGRNLIPALSDHEVIPCDVDTKSVEGPFDGIIHLAAISRVKDAEADRIKCLETNIVFTAQVLEFNPDWIIFASSMEGPESVYGFSKRAAEQYIEMRCKKYVILRLANVYGPGMKEDKLLAMIRANPQLKYPDTVFPFRHIHVKDVVKEILFSLQRINRSSEVMVKEKLYRGIAFDKSSMNHVAASY